MYLKSNILVWFAVIYMGFGYQHICYALPTPTPTNKTSNNPKSEEENNKVGEYGFLHMYFSGRIYQELVFCFEIESNESRDF